MSGVRVVEVDDLAGRAYTVRVSTGTLLLMDAGLTYDERMQVMTDLMTQSEESES